MNLFEYKELIDGKPIHIATTNKYTLLCTHKCKKK